MFKFIVKFVVKLVKEESGADMFEYVLVLSLVGLTCVAGFTTLGKSIENALGTTANAVTNSL